MISFDHDITLHVIAVISNPVGYESRYRLYREFANKMARTSNVNLITVELAFNNRPFVITETGNINHIQVRSNSELWHKENMINIGFSRLPEGWKYAAFIDADIDFINPHWVRDTIWQLQHHKIVQLFSKCIDLDQWHNPMQIVDGLVARFVDNGRQVPEYVGNLPKTLRGKDNGGIYTDGRFWHPGYAWSITKTAFDELGGLMEFPILGSADHLMALAILGQSCRINNIALSPGYLGEIHKWEQRALRFIQQDIGFVDGSIYHYFHGSKRARGYHNRTQILINHQFDPNTDLKKNSYGMLELVVENDRQIKLKDAIRLYFRSRNEDSRQ